MTEEKKIQKSRTHNTHLPYLDEPVSLPNANDLRWWRMRASDKTQTCICRGFETPKYFVFHKLENSKRS